MKKIKIIICLVLFLFLITSCGCSCRNENEYFESAYGIVHKDYVGKATVTVRNKKVTKIEIDEAFLPHTWAEVASSKNTSNENTIEIDGAIYPKYIKIGEEILEASEYDVNDATGHGTTKQKVKWSNDKIENLYAYVKEDEHAKWYYETVTQKSVYPCDNTGEKLDLTLKNSKFFKSEGGYWEGEQYNLGWKGNIEELIKGMISNNFKTEPSLNDESKIVFDGVTTGATLVDYADYYKIAKKAYDKIEK